MASGFAIEALMGEMLRLVSAEIRRRGYEVEFKRDPKPGEWGSYVQVGLPVEYRALEISRVSELLLVDKAVELADKATAGVKEGKTIQTAAWAPPGAHVVDVQAGEGIGLALGTAPCTGVTGETVIIFGMRHWV
jgi:hypothetical protein